MRVQQCTDVLQQIIPEALWLEVRKATCKWQLDSEPHNVTEARQKYYARNK